MIFGIPHRRRTPRSPPTRPPRRPIEPGPGQESVWDYPRPPRHEPAQKTVRVEFNGKVITESDRTIRVLETSHSSAGDEPPTGILYPP